MVLSAIEGTLKEQKCDFTPAGYFAALLALLKQSIPAEGPINKELATTVVYLLDLVTSHVQAHLLRLKFSDILHSLVPTLTLTNVEASLLRSSIGCLESLLVAQDAPAWALPPTQEGPRRAITRLLTLAVDHRPKVRKRAQDAITQILRNPPPSPALDHPAADMCAHAAMQSLGGLAEASTSQKNNAKGHRQNEEHTPGLMHALQLVKTIAVASGGWPSRKIEPLCKILMNISKSSNQYLTTTVLDVFEIMFARMANESSSTKLPRLMEALWELRPSQNDSQLLPPWIAVLSRGYDVSAQVSPNEVFQKLPEGFETISQFLTSPSHDIRTSASQCLISFLVNCIPLNVIIEPSVQDEKVLERLAKLSNTLLALKYQAAWMEVFQVLSALFVALKWRSKVITNDILITIGALHGNDSFTGKKEADAVLGQAIEAVGPEALLELLPLNLSGPPAAQPGRAWLLPILRDHVSNTNLSHFRSEFVPLSELMYQRILGTDESEKSMQTKIFETLIQQIWATLPGYCFLPLDLQTAFDKSFAELLSNLLYKQTALRVDVCKSLQTLVESNQQVLAVEDTAAEILLQRRITKADAQANLNHLSAFAGNLLSVLFNVYGQTLPQFRGHILQCINAYLSIARANELSETFARITSLLESALGTDIPQTQAARQHQKQPQSERLPPQSHTLMDLVITIAIYLPSSTYPTLFSLAALILPQTADPQLQKKAYKLIPRLATSPAGALALQERNAELQALLLGNASSAAPPCRHDRIATLTTIIDHLPSTDLHFIPSILSEVVISAKEVNEKTRTAAFDLLVLMAKRMSAGGTISQSKIPHMDSDSPDVQATLEEFFTMVSAGLVGSTPHMVSASITALTRVLYEFHGQISKSTVEDILETLALFLTSASREIVRSVLGFVKVAIISFPASIVQPRLGTLIPGLMSWSREHKAHFRAKIKHILERAVRRFGYEKIKDSTPEDDRKLLANIRKTKERAKRKRADGANGGTDEGRKEIKKGTFESEYDAAIHSSSDEEEDAGSEDGNEKERRKVERTYIMEDEDMPLDLLDKRTLGNISSSKPIRPQQSTKRRGKLNIDGKLVVGAGESDEEDDAMAIDFDESGRTKSGGEMSLEGGINAYVDAIRGRDAVQRGRGGRLKFSNKREKLRDKDAMDVDEETMTRSERPTKAVRSGGTANGARRGGAASGRSGLSGKKLDPKKQRRGLGMAKVSGGRVVKGAGRMQNKR